MGVQKKFYLLKEESLKEIKPILNDYSEILDKLDKLLSNGFEPISADVEEEQKSKKVISRLEKLKIESALMTEDDLDKFDNKMLELEKNDKQKYEEMLSFNFEDFIISPEKVKGIVETMNNDIKEFYPADVVKLLNKAVNEHYFVIPFMEEVWE